MDKDEVEVAERTVGGAVGVFFLSYLVMVVVANVATAMLYGTIGAGGSLLGSVIVAVLWKRGTLGSWGHVVGASMVLGLIALALTLFLAPAAYQMRFGG